MVRRRAGSSFRANVAALFGASNWVNAFLVRVSDNAPEATLRQLPKKGLHRQCGRIIAKEGFP